MPACFYPSAEPNCIIYPKQNGRKKKKKQKNFILFLEKSFHFSFFTMMYLVRYAVVILALLQPEVHHFRTRLVGNARKKKFFRKICIFFKNKNDNLHVANLVANVSLVHSAASDRVHATSSLVSGSTVASPGTRSPFRPNGPLRL
jgi:hypothetical protein